MHPEVLALLKAASFTQHSGDKKRCQSPWTYNLQKEDAH